jgi:hypothetical protein
MKTKIFQTPHRAAHKETLKEFAAKGPAGEKNVPTNSK